MFRYLAKLSLTTLRYNKLRTLLTGLGIFVGVLSIILIISLSDSYSHYLSGEISREIQFGLMSRQDGAEDFRDIIQSDEFARAREEILRMPFVRRFEQRQGEKQINLEILGRGLQSGVSIDFNDEPMLAEGQGFSQRPGDVVIAGASFLDADDGLYQIGQEILIDNRVFTIIGQGTDGSATLFFPTRYSGVLPYYESQEAFSFDLELDAPDREKTKGVLARLNEAVSEPYVFVNYSDVNEELITEMFSSVTLLLSLIASISLIVSAINIINIMHIAVLERAGEIAIYRSMGMTKKMVLFMFLVESFLLVFLFSLLAYLIGLLSAFVILAFMKIPLYVSIRSILILLGICLFLGIGAGIRPAAKAARTDPAILLK